MNYPSYRIMNSNKYTTTQTYPIITVYTKCNQNEELHDHRSNWTNKTQKYQKTLKLKVAIHKRLKIGYNANKHTCTFTSDVSHWLWEEGWFDCSAEGVANRDTISTNKGE